MLLKWFILFFSLNLKLLESKAEIENSNFKNIQNSNDVLDTNQLKISQLPTVEKHYNKKFHYYTIKTLFLLSLAFASISLLWNLRYFWEPYTTISVLNNELNNILEDNIKFFESHNLFKNFNEIIDKLEKINTKSKKLDFSLVEKSEYKDEFKKEDSQLTSHMDERSIETISSNILPESDQRCEPVIKFSNNEKEFYSRLNTIDQSDSSSQSKCVFKTQFQSNIKEPLNLHNTLNINLSSSESSIDMNYKNVRPKDGKIEFKILNKY